MSAVTHSPVGLNPWLNLPTRRFMDWLDSYWPDELDLKTRLEETMRVEETTQDGAYVIRVEVPGVNPETDIDINIRDHVLTIEATREDHRDKPERSEFRYGHFRRSMTLPPGTDEKSVSATYVDGILEVAIAAPSPQPEPETHHVAVERGA